MTITPEQSASLARHLVRNRAPTGFPPVDTLQMVRLIEDWCANERVISYEASRRQALALSMLRNSAPWCDHTELVKRIESLFP